MTRTASRSMALAWLAWSAVCLSAWLAYAPGLSGGFLFDDYVNLDALGRYGDPRTLDVFLRYITSGTADPTGRPLSLLTFLVDAHSWPADPYPFLRTNVLLHLLNGTLLYLLLRALGRVLDEMHGRAGFAALVGAGLWLLHPLFVSTTLYAVQREAMLPASFTLIGLIGYVNGRTRYADTAGRTGTTTMVASISAATFLAVLSKANGILLPALALVLELSILRPFLSLRPGSRQLRAVHWLLLVVPSLLVAFYILRPLQHLHVMPANRTWTIGQRLLTEPRVLFDYLELLIVPRSISTGLFNDGYRVSQSLVDPWTTVPSLLALVALAGLAYKLRMRTPAVSCAVFFFLTGHVLESSTLPLELYFEHRNYLPAMLLFWPVALALGRWSAGPAARASAAALLLAGLALVTFQRASLWGDPVQLAKIWAASNPGSARAQTVAALSERQVGGPRASLGRLLPLWAQHPYELQFAFNVIDARCTLGGVPEREKVALEAAFLHASRATLMTHAWLANAIEVARSGRCGDLDLADVSRWVDAALANPATLAGKHRDQDFEPLLGRLALYAGRPDDALRHLDRALKAYPNPDQAARQAVLLASNGYYDQALAHLAAYERMGSPMPSTRFDMSRLHHQVLAWQQYWPRELAALRAKIVEEKAKETTR